LFIDWMLLQELPPDTCVGGVRASRGLTLLWLVQQFAQKMAPTVKCAQNSPTSIARHLLLFVDMQALNHKGVSTNFVHTEPASRPDSDLGVSLRYAWYEERSVSTVNVDQSNTAAHGSVFDAACVHQSTIDESGCRAAVQKTSLVVCTETGHRPEDPRIEGLIRELTRRRSNPAHDYTPESNADCRAAPSAEYINIVLLLHQHGENGELRSWWPVQLSVRLLLTHLWNTGSSEAFCCQTDFTKLSQQVKQTVACRTFLDAVCQKGSHAWDVFAQAQSCVVMDFLCSRLTKAVDADQAMTQAVEMCFAHSARGSAAEVALTELQRYATAHHGHSAVQPLLERVDALVRIEPLTERGVREWLQVDPLVHTLLAPGQTGTLKSVAQQNAIREALAAGPVFTCAFAAGLVLRPVALESAVLFNVRRDFDRACSSPCNPVTCANLYTVGFNEPVTLTGCVAQVVCSRPNCRLFHLVGDPVPAACTATEAFFLWQMVLRSVKEMARDFDKSHVVWHYPLHATSCALQPLTAHAFLSIQQSALILMKLGSINCFGLEYPTALISAC
jgi:hypothetical protein